jgi:hypothetical protein
MLGKEKSMWQGESEIRARMDGGPVRQGHRLSEESRASGAGQVGKDFLGHALIVGFILKAEVEVFSGDSDLNNFNFQNKS